ncbi:MAG: ABC transporter ATP-binding protein [Pseudomonadota bacterium]
MAADPSTPTLSLRDLTVEIPVRDAVVRPVNAVSFDIAPGEILGVVGESGAGKSMTGSAAIGLIEPPGRIASGSVWLSGERIDHLPHEQLRRIRGARIGTVFQDPMASLNPLFTVGEQLEETILTHLPVDRAGAKRRAIAALDEVGIPAAESRYDAYPHEFSGGMRQRVVIALALAGEPELVIADEPTTALDVSVQAQIVALLRRLCRERGVAVMLITHDMGVIAETVDRVAVMYAGRLIELGPVEEVVARPKHPYAEGLMGATPSAAALADAGEAAPRLRQIPGAMPGLTAIPPGCAFHPRCASRFDPCDRELPPSFDTPSGRVACWRYDPANPAAGDAGADPAVLRPATGTPA